MLRTRLYLLRVALAACAIMLGACDRSDADPEVATDPAPSTQPGPQPPDPSVCVSTGTGVPAIQIDTSTSTSPMRVEVSLADRRLYVLRGDERSDSFRVAVGSQEWPTQTGDWTIRQVVWNPEWIPPDESWDEEREPRKPGDPKNPLGRAQLVYDPPRTVHGTNDPSSIGKAVSHGSIRMRNEDITRLARDIMESVGAGRDSTWYDRARTNRTEKIVVDLPQPVPIRVY
jgi:lipoprotein-anchoring transpeptidase ErfK/SrfK